MSNLNELKNVQPLQDFDWQAFESGSAVGGQSQEELEKAYDETLNKVQEHQVVDGTVIAMNKREVVVNIGYKSDGIIPISEFRYNPELKVGDTVEVYVENQEVHKTEQELSGKAIRYITTEGLKNSKELKKIIKDGDIFALVTKRGGLDVSHLGIAVWGKDGNLHILNASSLHKRVILEPHSMYDYMKPQKMQTGVRVVRIL